MLRRGLVIPSSCSMRYVLAKQKTQSSDVNTFDWLNLRHMEKYDKRRTLKNSKSVVSDFLELQKRTWPSLQLPSPQFNLLAAILLFFLFL